MQKRGARHKAPRVRARPNSHVTMSKAARAQIISPFGRPRNRVHTTLHASDQGTKAPPNKRRTIDGGRESFSRKHAFSLTSRHDWLSPVRWRAYNLTGESGFIWTVYGLVDTVQQSALSIHTQSARTHMGDSDDDVIDTAAAVSDA
eukprot:5771347-Prymnesium_polylepis.1